jgi:hypothetical protein
MKEYTVTISATFTYEHDDDWINSEDEAIADALDWLNSGPHARDFDIVVTTTTT